MSHAAVAAPQRDPETFAPLFLLAPARTNSTVASAMIGMHPQLRGFPELALFRRETVGELMVDPPGWRGAPARRRMAGLLRSIAELHDGEQTDASIEAATAWLDARQAWPTASVYDHLLEGHAPRIGVEKSPENAGRDDYLRRLNAAYPRARYIHLTRHPVPSVNSMYEHWHKLDYWTIEPEVFHQFCLGVWYFQHRRIRQYVQALAPERSITVRSEDLLNAPATELPRICAFLGIDAGAEAIEAMRHPERSPFARIGPGEALGGGDSGFLRNPVLRTTELSPSLDVPPQWHVDPWQVVAAIGLAGELGYTHTDS